MKERPILFSAPMVNAVLDDKKNQTRRAVKKKQCIQKKENGNLIPMLDKCPYGAIGDELWVRENFKILSAGAGYESNTEAGYDAEPGGAIIEYAAGGKKTVGDLGINDAGVDEGLQAVKFCKKTGWNPSIFLPRWASRIQLIITDIKIERLQDISEKDALAEGIVCYGKTDSNLLYAHYGALRATPTGIAGDIMFTENTAVGAYKLLWESINGKGSWAKNPWVWAVTFKKEENKYAK